MEKVAGKKGEKVIVAGSYKCSEHPSSWFFFNKNETFRLCPRCKIEHKQENIWHNTAEQPVQSVSKQRFSHFLSSFFGHF